MDLLDAGAVLHIRPVVESGRAIFAGDGEANSPVTPRKMGAFQPVEHRDARVVNLEDLA